MKSSPEILPKEEIDYINSKNERDSSNNKFWCAGDFENTVKASPFRAYLKNTGAGAKAHTLSISIAGDNEDETAVEAINALTEGTAEYYDMEGRSTGSLQKGVNIVKMSNGKTVKVNIK